MRNRALVLLMAGTAASVAAHACNMNVREAGFITNAGTPYVRYPYQLQYVCRKVTPETEARAKAVQELCAREAINLEPVVIATEKLSAGMLRALRGRGIDPEELPVSAVFQYAGAQMPLLLTSGGMEETVVRALVASPAKTRLLRLLSDNGNYCVILFVPGPDASANAAARGVIEEAVRAHAAARPGQRMPILDLDGKDPRESFLLSELGAKGGEPFAAVVFGKGRVLIPSFEGRGIRKEALLAHFAFLNHNASDCGMDAVFVDEETCDLLMRWGEELDRRMIRQIADSGTVPPELAEELRVSNWEEVWFDATGRIVDRPPVDAPAPGTVSPGPPPLAVAAPPSPVPVAGAQRAPVWSYALPATGGVLLLVLAAGWLVIRRRGTA